MSRDARFTAHRLMRRVDPRTQTPVPAILLILALGFVLMVALPGAALLELITASTILLGPHLRRDDRPLPGRTRPPGPSGGRLRPRTPRTAGRGLRAGLDPARAARAVRPRDAAGGAGPRRGRGRPAPPGRAVLPRHADVPPRGAGHRTRRRLLPVGRPRVVSPGHDKAPSHGTVRDSALWLLPPDGARLARQDVRAAGRSVWGGVHLLVQGALCVAPVRRGVAGTVAGGRRELRHRLPQVKRRALRTHYHRTGSHACHGPRPALAAYHPSSGSTGRAQHPEPDLPSGPRYSCVAQASRRARTASSTRLP